MDSVLKVFPAENILFHSGFVVVSMVNRDSMTTHMKTFVALRFLTSPFQKQQQLLREFQIQ